MWQRRHSVSRLRRIDQGKEFAHVDRLGQIVAGAIGAKALDLLGGGVGTDHHNGKLRRAGIGA